MYSQYQANIRSSLIRSVRPFVGFRRFGEANIDERHLAAGDGLESTLERRSHFAGFFHPFAVAVECPRDSRVVGTRIDGDANEVLILYGKPVGEETGNAGLLRVIAVVVVEHDHDR